MVISVSAVHSVLIKQNASSPISSNPSEKVMDESASQYLNASRFICFTEGGMVISGMTLQ